MYKQTDKTESGEQQLRAARKVLESAGEGSVIAYTDGSAVEGVRRGG